METWTPSKQGQLLVSPIEVDVAAGATAVGQSVIPTGRGNVKRLEIVISEFADAADYDDVTIQFLVNSTSIVNPIPGTFFKPQYQNVMRRWDLDIPESAVVSWQIANASANPVTVTFVLHYV